MHQSSQEVLLHRRGLQFHLVCVCMQDSHLAAQQHLCGSMLFQCHLLIILLIRMCAA